MNPGEQAYIVAVEAHNVVAVSAEAAANQVRDAIYAGVTDRVTPLLYVRVVRSTPGNPTIQHAIHRGEAGAL